MNEQSIPTFLAHARAVMIQRDTDGIRGLDREASRFRCHIEGAAFAAKSLDAVTSPDIREWLREMAQKNAITKAKGGSARKLSRHTISRCQSLISAVFVDAIEREIITTNPCAGVRPKRRVDESDTEEKWAYLSFEEQQRIAACPAIPVEDRLAIRFAIATGLRQGEQRHLELDDLILEPEQGCVVVRYASRRKGEKLPPKSGKRRTIPLFGDGLAAAREWLALLPTFAPDNPERLVFPSPRGKIRHQGKPLGATGTLRKHYLAAGVKLRPGLHWHALRHTCATNLVIGVLGRRWTLEEVQVLMGHSSITITQRYAHVGGDAITRAALETVEATAQRTQAPLMPPPPPPPSRPGLAKAVRRAIRNLLARAS